METCFGALDKFSYLLNVNQEKQRKPQKESLNEEWKLNAS